MSDYTNTEREINLIDLLYCVLKQWRRVLLGAVIIALLAGLYQVYRGRGALLGGVDPAETAEYESSLALYQETEAQLKENLVKLQNNLTGQLEYNQKSQLMQIDPMNKWVGTLRLHVDAKEQDAADGLLYAYAGLLGGEDTLDALLAQRPEIGEPRFLTEVYSVVVSPDDAAITVTCVGPTEQAVRTMTDCAKAALAGGQARIAAEAGEHTCTLVAEQAYVTVDAALEAAQKENRQLVSDFADQITATNSALTNWVKEQPQAPITRNDVIKRIVKYLVLGGVLGIFLMCAWYACRYALNDTVKTDDDWRLFQVPVLGRILREQEKKKFLPGLDAWLDRLFHRTREAAAQSCALTAHSVGAALREQGRTEALLVGRLPEGQAEELTRQMNAAETGVSFRYLGDLLTDPAAARALEEAPQVLLLAERYGTRCAEVGQTLTLLKAWGKSALGVVVVE